MPVGGVKVSKAPGNSLARQSMNHRWIAVNVNVVVKVNEVMRARLRENGKSDRGQPEANQRYAPGEFL